MNHVFAVKHVVRRTFAPFLVAAFLPWCVTEVSGLEQPSAAGTTNAGDAHALFLSGRAFDRGEGELRDFAKARQMYEKAAAQGHALAMNNLGSMYFHGRGVARNEKKAFEWFKKSAEGGADLAQVTVGSWLQDGRVMPRDVAAAVEWFQRAAKQGNINAQRRLALIYFEGAEGVAKDYMKAAALVKPLAEAGDPWGMNTLGVMHEFGHGMPKDDAEAVHWIEKAARTGDPKALFNLGSRYASGQGVPRDTVQACVLLKVSLMKGEGAAKAVLDELSRKLTPLQADEVNLRVSTYSKPPGLPQ